MTEIERRNFLLWAAGCAFAALTSNQASAAVRSMGGVQGGKTPADKVPAKKPGDKQPASKPASTNSKELEPGAQTDGSYVLDPANPPKLDIKSKEEPGGFFVKVGPDTVLVAQSEDKKKWYAVSAICPHKATMVCWKAKDQIFRCPEHGSKFTTDGKVTKGPAKEDLSPYKVEEVKGKGGKKFVRISKK